MFTIALEIEPILLVFVRVLEPGLRVTVQRILLENTGPKVPLGANI
jgi:hypothetical protein